MDASTFAKVCFSGEGSGLEEGGARGVRHVGTVDPGSCPRPYMYPCWPHDGVGGKVGGGTPRFGEAAA